MKIIENKINDDVILSNHKLNDKEIINAYSKLVKQTKKQLAIYKRAFELACNDIQDMYCSDYCMCARDESCKVKCCYQIYYNKEQFLDQAKKEVEEEDGNN